MPASAQALIAELQTVPPDRQVEAEDFVDFIQLREEKRAFTRDAL